MNIAQILHEQGFAAHMPACHQIQIHRQESEKLMCMGQLTSRRMG
jgi:hypothetical protein